MFFYHFFDLLLVEEGEGVLERQAEVVAPALGLVPVVVTPDGLLRGLHEGAAGGEIHRGDEIADHGAVKTLVGGEVGKHGEGRAADDAELHRAPAETLLKDIEVEAEETAGGADEYEGIGADAGAVFGPEVGRVVEGGRVAGGAVAQFPCGQGDGDEGEGGDQDAAPGQVGDGAGEVALRIGSR